MDTTPSDESTQNLVAETRDIWDSKAEFWDAHMGDGNLFQRELIGPAVERLLAVQPGELVLDVACGNGVNARRLAQLGAQVVATDFSARFLELARARPSAHPERIEYRQVDATDEAQLLALGEGRFDAAICTMGLMDMPVIEPLLRALTRLLKPAGRFVFAVQHPAFNSNAITLGVEEAESEDGAITTSFIKVRGYLTVPPGRGGGMPGEPATHWYFHRPLSVLFGACFAAGFVLDGLEEPGFPPTDPGAIPLSWQSVWDMPPILAARCRLR